MGAEVSGLYPVAMPERVTRVAIDTPRGYLAALDAWPADSVPFQGTAVLVPGFGGSKEDFIPMLTPIVAAGYRALCYDQRGQYESTGPADVRAYSMKLFAEDLQIVTAAVAAGQPVHLLGHSFGGLVARRVVITAPKAARSLTLLDSGPDGASLSQARLLRLASWLIRIGGPRPMVAATCWAARRAGRTSRAASMAQAPATKHEPSKSDRDVPRDGSRARSHRKPRLHGCTDPRRLRRKR